MATNNLEIIIKAQDYASKELKKIEKQVKGMRGTFKKTGKSISDFGTRNAETFKKIGVGAGIATTAIAYAGKQFLDLGTQIQQTQNKANIVFGDYIGDVKKIAQETATAMGLSQNEYLNAAAGIQDLLIPMGFAREEATKMTTDMVGLAGALSEWSAGQYTAAQTSKILADAMLGNTEQLKGMGIQIDQSTKQFNERIKLISEETGVTLKQAKALDIQRQIFENSTDAQKSYEEGAGSLVRQQAELAATMKDARDSIAIALIPTMNELIKTMAPVITDIATSIKLWAENKENVEDMKETLTTTIKVFKTIGKVIGFVIKSLHNFGKVIGFIVADVVIKISSLKELGPKALEWGTNLIKMFTKGIKDGFKFIADAVEGVATTVSDYLGFHSPTKKGPASDSDKWIPNLMKMLSQGFENGTDDIKKAVNRVSKGIKDGFKLEDLKGVLETIQVNAIATFNNMGNSITSQKEKVNGLYKEYKNLEGQIKAIDESISGIKTEGFNELANRAVEIENNLKNIKEEIAGLTEDNTADEKKLLQEKQKQLETELELSKTKVTDTQIQEARIELEKTQTQKIIDRINARIEEAEAEKIRIQELMTLKKEEIRSEFEIHKAMIDAKIVLENQYFDLFSTKIKKQESEINSVILKMKQLLTMKTSSSNNGVDGARASGGPVTGGKTYLVGEKGPELFTPNTSGGITANNKLGGNVNINMGGVVVNNSADENRLVEKIKSALVTEAKMFNLGIS